MTVLNNTIFLDVFITLDVTSDGANGLTTGWTLEAANPLLGALGNAAELGALNINALISGDATGAPINSGLNPGVVGGFVGDFYVGPAGPLRLETPAQINAGAGTAVPTSAGTANVNWDGTFTLQLDLGGMPLVVVDESVCDFSIPGAGVDFAVAN